MSLGDGGRTPVISRLERRMTYANVVSSLCLFLVLAGGSAFAATQITGAQIASNAITSAKVKNGSLLKVDFKSGQLPKGPRGLTGPAGAAGRAGRERRERHREGLRHVRRHRAAGRPAAHVQHDDHACNVGMYCITPAG